MGEAGDARTEVQRSIDDARLELIRTVRAGHEWRDLAHASLTKSLRESDADGFAATVQFLVYLFDADSRLDEALAEIKHALDLAAGSRTARGFLLAQRAALLAAQGHVEPAREAADESESLLEDVGAASGRKWPVLMETVRLKLLEPPSARMPALARTGGSADSQADYSFLLSWHIPYLAARGDHDNAQALIPLARAAAEATEHRWRLSDVNAFESWLAALSGRGPTGLPGKETSTLAALRQATLGLRFASQRRDLPGISRSLVHIEDALSARKSADHGGYPPWEAVGRMLMGDRSLLAQLQPPQHVTLSSVGTWLAAAYAVALGGSRDLSALWLPWVRGLGRRGIESSLEWPVARRRIEALLLLRCGQQARASVEMQRAADWATGHGYRVEAAAAGLQAEKMGVLFSGPRRGESDARGSSHQESLVEKGFDPWPHIAVVESAVLAGSGDQPALLTARELATLKLLADDLSYREAGVEMGVSWQTVRSVARSIYQKLGVTSKHQAAEEARKLGLL